MCYQNKPCGCDCDTSCSCAVYEDCGCLTTVTFDCITKPPVLAYIPVSSDMNGSEVLKAIDDTVGTIQEAIAAFTNPIQNTVDTHVKISATDALTGYLETKLVKGLHTSLTKKAGQNGVETLQIAVTPKTMISGLADNLIVEKNGLVVRKWRKPGCFYKPPGRQWHHDNR
jgi:hypothetical protein